MEKLNLATLMECGDVRRWHTFPVSGRVSPTVASHSWGVAMIILAYNRAPSHSLMQHALTHDLAERFTGDMPSPVKTGDLSRHLDRIEAAAITEHFPALAPHALNETDTAWFMLAHTLETLAWAQAQKAMGNTKAQAVFDSIRVGHETVFNSYGADSPAMVGIRFAIVNLLTNNN